MAASRVLTSVGIDIGTTTSQLAVSELSVENTARFGALPRMEITARRVRYLSPVDFTPLREDGLLDVAAMRGRLATWYREAGIAPGDVDTGAVIVTGESARTENARAALDAVAQAGGDFVVATAGPELEALLAGIGAGARERSLDGSRVLTLDVGGGTTNAACFKDGRALECFALDIGGRLVRADAGRISYVSERLRPFMAARRIELSEGEALDACGEELVRLARGLAGVLVRLARRVPLDAAEQTLWIGDPARGADPVDCVMVSGGVGEFVRDGRCAPPLDATAVRASFACFGDMGPLLGWAIAHGFGAEGIALGEVAAPGRATVIGAGSHAVTLSGSTVFCGRARFPKRNLPVIEVFPDGDEEYARLAHAAARARARYDAGSVAYFLHGPEQPRYAEVRTMALQFAEVLQPDDAVLLENDFAKALGQQLALVGIADVVVLDGISLARGDYIDIGRPIGDAVPVVVKTLICA